MDNLKKVKGARTHEDFPIYKILTENNRYVARSPDAYTNCNQEWELQADGSFDTATSVQGGSLREVAAYYLSHPGESNAKTEIETAVSDLMETVRDRMLAVK